MSNVDFLSMSDDELREYTFPADATVLENTDEDEDTQEQQEDGDDTEATTTDDAEATDDDDHSEDGEDNDADEEEQADAGQEDPEETPPVSNDNTPADTQGTPDRTTDTKAEEASSDEASAANSTTESVDYKNFYDTLTAPLRANGTDYEIKDVEHARRLMSMGIGFNKKNEELKPLKAIQRTLQSENIDNERLSLLIDINNGNVEALAKLVKEKDINLDYFDIDAGDSYTAQNKVTEVTPFQETLYELNSDENFKPVVDDVTKWDEESKQLMFKRPEILRALVQSKGNGRYDKVMQRVDYMESVGLVPAGQNKLQSYYMAEQEVLAAEQAQSSLQPPAENTNARGKRPSKKKQVDPNAEARKQAAALGTKSSNANAAPTDSDLARMSDAELVAYYEKLNTN